MDSQKLTKLLLAAGGAVAVGAVAYFLLKKDEKASNADAVGQKRDLQAAVAKGQPVDKITKEQVMQMLQEIIVSQDQMKGYLKELSSELLSKSLTFDQTYHKVKKVQPDDPLEKHGLSMVAFDDLLEKHRGDQGVREMMTKIMGAPNPNSCHSEKVQAITVKTIIEVHNFMLEELNNVVKDFNAHPNKDSYDMKTVTVTAQAIVSSKIECKFNITSEDIESAVLMYHTMLATDQEFAAINIKIQHTMGKLMGTPFMVR